jgi:hypothetical protein
VFYHYTGRSGLGGILKTGGLWATHRWTMNDKEEFGYAQRLIDEVLDEMATGSDLPNVATRLARECRVNLDRILTDSEECSRAYCACLSLSRDQESQWESYADGGKGFSLGFYLPTILRTQQFCVEAGRPYLFCAPVRYQPDEQKAMVRRVLEEGIQRVKIFADSVSNSAGDLTAFYRTILGDVVAVITAYIDFIKHPDYRSECEMRIMRDPNDGTLNAQDIRHFSRGGLSVPYLFFDLRNPSTGRLPLDEIIIGPNAASPDEILYVERLLDGIRYGSRADRPKVVQSSISTSELP